MLNYGSNVKGAAIIIRLNSLYCILAIYLLFAADNVVFAEIPTDSTVTSTVEFRVLGPGVMVPNTRILIVDNKGHLISSGLTDKNGIWKVLLTVDIDPRFSMVEKMGTVTAISIANGYKEDIIFDVPVRKDAVQIVSLSPLVKNTRNEPTYSLGMLHRLTVFPLIDIYAKQEGLARENSIEGDLDSPHWSPNIVNP
ncbi:hypothetical protein ACI7RC_17565 [Brevibacillus sp. B_LB10_24]|uniref:hypothetical protein n=1 Tax=Brevibacillus sp. B_LB10_24 TaxID=3380645 RepID=UPI0038B9294A